MKTVVGILKSRSDGELAVERLQAIGIKRDHINMLTPDASGRERSEIPTTETEQPGTGPALGGVVGGALGAAGGMSLGTAVASLLAPGIGSILAIGIAAAAILGALGAVGGAISGEALEDSMARGLPIDELFVYEDALRQGRTMVIAFANDEAQSDQARQVMREAGAESVDAARENWWVGLRDDERAVYSQEHDDFEQKEPSYRHGFEAALHPSARGRSYGEAVDDLRTIRPKEFDDKSFRLGYERGHAYYVALLADRQTRASRIKAQ